jgi:glutamate formiminotransferase
MSDTRTAVEHNRSFVQCPINISEGRSTRLIQKLGESVLSAQLADVSPDADHNRTVFTLVGPLNRAAEGAKELARCAVENLDIRTHAGVHPRMGVVDVVPFVPWRDTTPEECAQTAAEFAQWIARTLQVPAYLYEWAARKGRPVTLPALRRLAHSLPPDFGDTPRHPTAGAAVIGARPPLIAWNILLKNGTHRQAQEIAAQIRQERHHNTTLKGVRALGLWLTTQNTAQISMNVTDTQNASLPAIYRWIAAEAETRAAEIGESEIVGLVPTAALGGEPPEAINWKTYKPQKLVEYWMQAEPPRRE